MQVQKNVGKIGEEIESQFEATQTDLEQRLHEAKDALDDHMRTARQWHGRIKKDIGQRPEVYLGLALAVGLAAGLLLSNRRE
jgi:ElaB/YqjD/DUF883 family membrane-anchored ribosome-binding protein